MATNTYIDEDKIIFNKHYNEAPEKFLQRVGTSRTRRSNLDEDGYKDYAMSVQTCSISTTGKPVELEVYSFMPGFNRENYRLVVRNFFVQMKDFIAAYSTFDSEGAELLNEFYLSWCDHFQNYADDLNKYGKALTIPSPTKIQKCLVDAYTRSVNAKTQEQKKAEYDLAYVTIQDSLAFSYATNIMSTCEGNLSLSPKDKSKYGKTNNK